MHGNHPGDDRDLEDEIQNLAADISMLQNSVGNLEERSLYDLMEELTDLSQSIGDHKLETRLEVEKLRNEVEELKNAQERSAEAQEEMVKVLKNINSNLVD